MQKRDEEALKIVGMCLLLYGGAVFGDGVVAQPHNGGSLFHVEGEIRQNAGIEFHLVQIGIGGFQLYECIGICCVELGNYAVKIVFTFVGKDNLTLFTRASLAFLCMLSIFSFRRRVSNSLFFL